MSDAPRIADEIEALMIGAPQNSDPEGELSILAPFSEWAVIISALRAFSPHPSTERGR